MEAKALLIRGLRIIGGQLDRLEARAADNTFDADDAEQLASLMRVLNTTVTKDLRITGERSVSELSDKELEEIIVAHERPLPLQDSTDA